MTKKRRPNLCIGFVLLVFCLLLPASLNKYAIGESPLLNKPVDSQKTTSMIERLNMRRKDFKPELTTDLATSISERCVSAQKKISDLRTKDTGAMEKYYTGYGEIADQVSALIGRMKQQSASTAAPQTALNQYIDAVNRYLVNAESYSSSIADIQAMDCAADAEGFVATLESARESRANLADDIQTIEQKVDDLSAALTNAKSGLDGDRN